MNVEVTPNYSYVFDFENEFIHQETRNWMTKNWTWGFYYCGIYMLVIFGGQHYMQSRPRLVNLMHCLAHIEKTSFLNRLIKCF